MAIDEALVITEPLPVPPSSISKQHDLIDVSEPSSHVPSELDTHSRSTLSLTNQTAIFTSSSSVQPLNHDAAFYTFPNSPNDSALTLARYATRHDGGDSDEDSDEESSLLPHTTPRPNPVGRDSSVVRLLHRVRHRIMKIWIAIRNFMTAPLWAVLFSLIVAFIDPLKHALEHHMQPLNRAINTAGKCAIPLTLVVLGAYFHDPLPEGNEGERVLVHRRDQPESTWQRIFCILRSTSKDSSKLKKQLRPGETKTIVLAIFARMILTPILLVPFLMLASRYDWHVIFDE